jgi:hypothetical protein
MSLQADGAGLQPEISELLIDANATPGDVKDLLKDQLIALSAERYYSGRSLTFFAQNKRIPTFTVCARLFPAPK